MSVASILSKFVLPALVLFLSSCQMSDLAQNSLDAFQDSTEVTRNDANTKTPDSSLSEILSLRDVAALATPKVNVDVGFSKAIASAVRSDPKVQIAKTEVLRRQASLGVANSRSDFQFSGTVYAGVEDVTDNTNGIAAVLNASKIVYDGGQILNSISAEEFAVQSTLEGYRAVLDERALVVGTAWVELERYQSLNALILGRLAVLDPLIIQLERVADAGVGDATQVAAAQRTVSLIRVTETDVQERLAQAELNFIRLFGKLPTKTMFDAVAVAKAVPKKVTNEMAMAAPGLLAKYSAYLSALKQLEVEKARDSVTVGFETKLQRPIGGSSYDSDESIGFVVRKTLYNGSKSSSEILASQAAVDSQKASMKDIYRRGREVVEAETQFISSMAKAIGMARSNAKALSDEIVLLRKQLIIGQSTLDKVLSAEARLYDAESKEINFTADKRTSHLTVLSAIGRLSKFFELDAKVDLN
jgi:outer membrane protein TolC